APERCHEGAGSVITHKPGDGPDLLPIGQEVQRRLQPQHCPPPPETHPRIRHKRPRQGAPAGARSGLLDEALDSLATAMKLNPNLPNNARRDADLAGLRESGKLAALLGPG